MPTESQDRRYRSGYAAGQRDAVVPGESIDDPERRSTDDPWADLGYRDGFADQRSRHHHWLVQVLWLPEIASQVRRLTRKETRPP